MREVKAIFRNERLDQVLVALSRVADLTNFTVSWVHGVHPTSSASNELPTSFRTVDMVKLEVFVADGLATAVTDIIRGAAQTGTPDDGTIVVVPLEDAGPHQYVTIVANSRYTEKPVVRLKHSLIVRAVVVWLLVWTGVDLGIAQLCASDRSAAPEAATLQAGTHTDAGNPVPASGADDCFCCSHTVMASTPVPVPGLGGVATSVVALDTQTPKTIGRPLYHPPQVSA